METGKEIILSRGVEIATPVKRPSRLRMGIAFGIAAVSDLVAMATTFAPPVQLALDFATAAALFVVMGRRWALVPGLIAEAIPGLGIFPVWVLVVLSIVIYDDVRKPLRR